jgi:hypothetical protein
MKYFYGVISYDPIENLVPVSSNDFNADHWIVRTL